MTISRKSRESSALFSGVILLYWKEGDGEILAKEEEGDRDDDGDKNSSWKSLLGG